MTERAYELSTGHKVTVPLSTTATMVGGLFTASVDAAQHLCPDGLAPVRVTAARTLVLLLGVDYHRIDDGQLDPYEEFGIFVLAAPGEGPMALPRALHRGIGGYTWQLPVTTEPARALGELWGYPKSVADITFTDDGRERQTTLAVDGTQLLSLTVRRPWSIAGAVSAVSFTDGDETVRREEVHADGDIGVAPRGVRVDIDDAHPWTDTLQVLGVGGRGLAAVGFDGEFVIDPPAPLDGR
jgi:hypothetical protein